MADWYVRFLDATARAYVGDYSLMNPTVEVRNSEPGGFTGEIALSQTKKNNPLVGIARDEFGPYRSQYEIWRDSQVISGGMVSSINFNKDRDTVLVSGKDWIHYLQRRIYPFNPTLYVSGDWVKWPRKWPDTDGNYGPAQGSSPIDVAIIVKQLLDATMAEDGSIPITHSVGNTGQTTRYQIYPGDASTIYDHITKLSEQSEKGFEFDISPLTLVFTLWSPRKNNNTAPVYRFTATDSELDGQIVEFDWTNDGPEATYLVGLGSGKHKVGAIWTDVDNVFEFKRMDKVHNFGEIQHTDLMVQMLKDQNDLHPQKKLALNLLNPAFLPLNFYTGGRPRSLIGATIWVTHDFEPLHLVDAFFRINAINWQIDGSTNENVALELEMVYDP